MHLNESEVARFYSIWFPLLHFVNQHRNVVPAFPKEWRNAGVSPEVAVPVRDTLWEDDSLRETFIAENPAQLSQDDLALVESWKYRIEDNFFIFRHLKKYTVFIDGSSPANAYGVQGITGPLEEIIGPYLPIYVKAVLIPFEDRIIYDSLLSSYPIHFGGGYRRSLKETYRDIQERGGIITKLPPDEDNAQEQAQASNKKVLTAFQKALGASGLSPKMIQEHSGSLADFAGEYMVKKTPSGMLVDLKKADIEAYRELRNGDINFVSFKRFIWFLRDTGRMDWDVAERLLKYLKQK
ncbi:hypothetical protein QQ056_15310 [Oscillatoria laete-virens NRMC-F 0139]|nr:hypothetical protein [Oscillatoria laete-virens]MDL5054906.1 hypothetical protein [Oscillatoria laete-virens NRMC-F 0139]